MVQHSAARCNTVHRGATWRRTSRGRSTVHTHTHTHAHAHARAHAQAVESARSDEVRLGRAHQSGVSRKGAVSRSRRELAHSLTNVSVTECSRRRRALACAEICTHKVGRWIRFTSKETNRRVSSSHWDTGNGRAFAASHTGSMSSSLSESESESESIIALSSSDTGSERTGNATGLGANSEMALEDSYSPPPTRRKGPFTFKFPRA
jgi:hypothetical protein